MDTTSTSASTSATSSGTTDLSDPVVFELGPRPAAPVGLAALCAGSGAIHLAMVPAHADPLLLAVGFAVVGWAQIVLAVALLRRPARRVLAATAAVNLVAAAAWAVSRTVGLPSGLDGSGPEPVGLVDGLATAFELLAVVVAAVGLLGIRSSRPVRAPRWRPLTAGLVPLAVLAVTTAALATPAAQHDHGAGHAEGTEAGTAHEHVGEHDHPATEAAHEEPDAHGAVEATVPHDHGGSGAAAASEEQISHLGDDHGHGECSTPATAAQQQAADDLVATTTAAVERYADLQQAVADGYTPITPPGAPIVHYGKLPFMADGRILDPSAVESLMYGFDKDRTPYFLGAMYLNDTPEVLPPAPGGCLTQWHDHTNLCIAPGKGMVAAVAPDGTCPPGSSNEVTSQMIHVWTIPLPDGPLSHEAPPTQVKAAVVEQQRAARGAPAIR